jgi:hypothetical protein
VEIFHALYEGLAEPSQRHFEAVAASVPVGVVSS